MSILNIVPGQLTLADLRRVSRETGLQLQIDPSAHAEIDASAATVARVLAEGRTVYGINTGFGLLANTKIATDELELLQRSIVLSHAAGIGQPMEDSTVRLVMALKINSLARGFSGIRRQVIDALVTLFNRQIYPVIPQKGSVGASGDLAPLSHMSAVLIGEGEAFVDGKRVSGAEAMRAAGLEPITLAPKEGLALLNGTQASTAFALEGLFAAEDLYVSATVAGSLS
ncbi:aromatic amino acid lyase, partial (plasmid) [Chromobacterium amazonense]